MGSSEPHDPPLDTPLLSEYSVLICYAYIVLYTRQLCENTLDNIILTIFRGEQYACPHQTMTSCSWWSVDGEDSFMSDVTYMMGVSITNKRTGEMFPLQTKAIKIDTTKIGRYMPNGAQWH